jgi:hypothetical protein
VLHDPTHLILPNFINRTILGEQYRSLSSTLRSFLHTPLTSSLLGPNILLSPPIRKHPQPTFLPQCERPSFKPTQNNSKIIVLYILIFIFLESRLEDKTFCTEWLQAFPDFSPLLTSSSIQFWLHGAVPKYLNCTTLSKDFLHIHVVSLSCIRFTRHKHKLRFLSKLSINWILCSRVRASWIGVNNCPTRCDWLYTVYYISVNCSTCFG